MSNQFEFYAPTRVIFGRDTEKKAGSLLREYGAQSVLLVYGGRSAEASGLLQTVRDSLEAEGRPQGRSCAVCSQSEEILAGDSQPSSGYLNPDL